MDYEQKTLNNKLFAPNTLNISLSLSLSLLKPRTGNLEPRTILYFLLNYVSCYFVF
jgi:hypothetical protein